MNVPTKYSTYTLYLLPKHHDQTKGMDSNMQLNLNHDLNRYCTVCNFGHTRMVPQSFLLYTLLPVPARCELKI